MPRKAVYLAILALAIAHQDFWWWDDRTLVLGFLPIGLAYHVAYSVAAALLWYAAIRWAWPEEAVRFAARDREGGADRP